MHEAAVQRRIGASAQHADATTTVFPFIYNLSSLGFAGQIAHRAGNDRHPVAAPRQVARQLVVAGATRFIDGDKSLVNE